MHTVTAFIGDELQIGQFLANGGQESQVVRAESLDALATVDFNLLCVPDGAAVAAAVALCATKRAFAIIDVPEDVTTVEQIAAWVEPFRHPNAAVYFPRLVLAGGSKAGARGTVAGIYARTDVEHGVWKAPAGAGMPIAGAQPASPLTHDESAALTAIGINPLRTFPNTGTVVWGARTLDRSDSEWRYVPVRRLALYIEETIDRDLRGAVFEPNGDPLWKRLRESAATFLNDLWREGALMGSTPHDAWFVVCDQSTMTPEDIAAGIVNITIGFAPLRPAEFVILTLRGVAAA